LKTRREATAWQKKFDAHAPKVGELAPDFELRDNRGENPLRLSDSRGLQPVVLVFGSFT
jgi:peroxiredoxin